MQITQISHIQHPKDITESLKKMTDPTEKYGILKEIFKKHKEEQPWLTRIKYHCKLIQKRVKNSDELARKLTKLREKIESIQVDIGHPPEGYRGSASRKRTDREDTPSTPMPAPNIHSTFRRHTIANGSTSPFHDLVTVASPVPAASLSQPLRPSSSLIDQLEFNTLRNFCETVRHWDPVKEKESILKSITHLIHFFETCDGIKKEIAIQIAHFYAKIGDLDQAKIYYLRTRDLGWEKAFWHLANIAFKRNEYNECIQTLKPCLPTIPDAFYLKDQFIDTFPEIQARNEEEKRNTINILKLLANAFEKLDETIIATRLREICASLGDEGIKKYLMQLLDHQCWTTVPRIIGEDKAYRAEVLGSPSIHRDNPARAMSSGLISKLIGLGFINTANEMIKPLLAGIVANEALSRFVCFTNNQCQDSLCSERTLQLCERVKLAKPADPLIAWIFATMHRDNPPPNMDELAERAMKEGFSDPRVSGASLYPVMESAPHSLLPIELDDDEFTPFASNS
ncbi:MAG: hypothetical protein ACHQUC_03400 [Chlamydiales bacterium]